MRLHEVFHLRFVSIENEIRVNNMTMADIEDNIIKHEGVYIGEDIQAEDVCQVVVKQTKLLDKEDDVSELSFLISRLM